MASLRRTSLAVAAVAACACACAAPATASQGYWGRDGTCPVDDPAMLASPAGDLTACVDLWGGGKMKYGNLNMRGDVDLAFGLHGPTGDSGALVPSRAPYSWSAYLDTSNVSVQQFLGPVCALFGPPTNYDPGPIYYQCWDLVSRLNQDLTIRAAIEPAGAPSEFRLSGAAGNGAVITLPVKLRLTNDVFGPACYIGSDAQPIVLHLSASGFTSHTQSADANGYPVTYDGYMNPFGGSLSDSAFAVPAAHGCGPGGSLDVIMNAAAGLPAASGNSVLLSRTADVHSTTAGGTVLSDAYHTALGYPQF